MLEKILSNFNVTAVEEIQPFGSGLINRTWVVKTADQKFILQKINQNVFKNPWHIAENIEAISVYLKKKHPQYFFVAPQKTKEGKSMMCAQQECYRLFPFVKDAYTHDVVQNKRQAYEAAMQFGLFTRLLSQLPLEDLKTTLPQFHDLPKRYEQFCEACLHGDAERIKNAEKEILYLQQQQGIVTTYNNITSFGWFKFRVTHHDTKISNVIFDAQDNGICVIDLDTVMPGYFISDVGDMMRTYLSPVSEEEKDLSQIQIREEYFEAIVQGYLVFMKEELNEAELHHFVYAGKFMIYMQAIRFLTDYLQKDRYYGTSYKEHNHVRAKNQITLLQRLVEKESRLENIVTQIRHSKNTIKQ